MIHDDFLLSSNYFIEVHNRPPFQFPTSIMKGTPIFNFRPWRAIHPPLPRTPRQSKQLLNALTSSFRRQLDQEYPLHSYDRSEINGDNHNTNHRHPNHSTEREKSTSNPNSSVHATDSHLKAILDNPLFRVVPSRGASVSHHDHSNLRPVEEGKRIVEEPMAVFDDLAASGSLTTSTISQCLKSQLLLASSPSSAGVDKAMKDSKAGSRVVAWFLASDSATRKSLLCSRASTPTLLKFMAAEGLQDTAMDWLQMLLKNDIGGDRNGQQAFRLFLTDFMAAEVQYGNGLSSAMKYYLQAYSLHFSLEPQPSEQLKRFLFLLSGGRLCQWVIEHSQDQAKEIPALLYDKFKATISVLSPSPLLLVSLPIYHPTHPDTAPLLKFVDEHPPEKFQSWKGDKREILLKVSFDAVQILVDRSDNRRALGLAQFIQGLLPSRDPSETTHKKHTSPEEDYLLSRLDLALS